MAHLFLCALLACFVQASLATKSNIHSFPERPWSSLSSWHWETGGSAQIQEDSVQLTPLISLRSGQLWCAIPLLFPNWEIAVDLKVHGEHSGGDGFVIWYTEHPMDNGDNFGHSRFFNGFGLVVDTMRGKMQLIRGDGEKEFQYDSYGGNLRVPEASCSVDFRSKKQSSQIQIRYLSRNGIMEVSYSFADSTSDECFDIENFPLSRGFYVGITAQTWKYDPNSVEVFDVEISSLDEKNSNEKNSNEKNSNEKNDAKTESTDHQVQKDDIDWLQPLVNTILKWHSLSIEEKRALKSARAILISEIRTVHTNREEENEISHFGHDDEDESHHHSIEKSQKESENDAKNAVSENNVRDRSISETKCDIPLEMIRNLTIENFIESELGILQFDLRDLQQDVRKMHHIFDDANHDFSHTLSFFQLECDFSSKLFANSNNNMSVCQYSAQKMFSHLSQHESSFHHLFQEIALVKTDIHRLRSLLTQRVDEEVKDKLDNLFSELKSVKEAMSSFSTTERSHQDELARYIVEKISRSSDASFVYGAMAVLMASQWIAVAICIRLCRVKQSIPERKEKRHWGSAFRRRKPSLGTSSPA